MKQCPLTSVFVLNRGQWVVTLKVETLRISEMSAVHSTSTWCLHPTTGSTLALWKKLRSTAIPYFRQLDAGFNPLTFFVEFIAGKLSLGKHFL
jgi:hypothetical protein